MHVRITCSVYRYVCRRVVFLYKAAFLVISRICVNGICFGNVVICTQNISKTQRKNSSVVSTLLLCKRNICDLLKR